MKPGENFSYVQSLIYRSGRKRGLNYVMGISTFSVCYHNLMPIQQNVLKTMVGSVFDQFIRNGSVISIAFAYPEYAIDSIGLGEEKNWDKDRWNIYSRAYKRLNAALNETANFIAQELKGIAIPATIEGIASKVKHVEEYYANRVSHRVAAELSGVGWQGKNELIVNSKYSCAIRLASVLTTLPITRTSPTKQGCGDCRACLNACRFLDCKENLDNYREQCRRYIMYLGLDDEVCGKCVKACYRDSVYNNLFKL